MKYILTIDAGTTSVRALLFNVNKSKIERIEKAPFKQIFPKPAWVEHNPEEIWEKVKLCIEKVCEKVKTKDIYGIGITNQRETTVAWDKTTGNSLYNAIVWQCRRTSKDCEKLKASKFGKIIHEKTGLIPDAYFSATKMKWLLDNVPSVKKAMKEKTLCFGTIESYLVYKLTEGKSYVTDITNASRTMLFNIKELKWDDDLLKIFKIPDNALPKVVRNDEVVGESNILGAPVKVGGLIGDQQSSLFGQGCFDEGMAKNTYGTGCFMLFNTGTNAVQSKKGLLTTIGFKTKNRLNYALEGSVFNAGSVVDWAIDGLGIAKTPKELTDLALQLKDNEGVYLVPAFSGLGTPYWDMEARGMICGMTRGTDKRHIARASLEAMAYSTYDVLKTVEKETKNKIKELRVDGGGSQNDFLMQYQCDLLQTKLKRLNLESTCMGSMFLTGLATGAYKNLTEIKKIIVSLRDFEPQMKEQEVKPYINNWHTAVKRSLNKKEK